MKIEGTLRSLAGADPALIVLLVGALMFLSAALLLYFRPPVLAWLMLVIGSAVATPWPLVNAVGLLGKYPMLLGLAVVSVAIRGRYHISRFGKFYLFYCGVIFLGVFNARAPEHGVSMFEGFVKVACFLLAFVGIYILAQKLVSRPDWCRQLLPWFILWAVIVILLQVPFWSFRHMRFTGLYDTAGTLQHSLARSILILLIFVLCRSGRWLIPGAAALVLAGFMLLLTGGRTAIGSVVFALPFALRLRPSRAAIALALVAVLAAVVVPTQIQAFAERQWTFTHLTSTHSGRFEWWQQFWSAVLRAPLVGHGTNTSEPFSLLGWGSTTHNSYLDLAYDHGVPFAVLFAFFMIAAIWRAWAQLGSVPPGPQRELVALSGAMLVMLALEGVFLSDLVRINVKWFLVCFCLGIQDGVVVWQRAIISQPAAHPARSSPLRYVRA